ncbi:MAG: AraC family transcriptional regulator [Desulfobacterales bacterium]|nr:AraC family transcriptional regulator [Desulfobacterales bacterium]
MNIIGEKDTYIPGLRFLVQSCASFHSAIVNMAPRDYFVPMNRNHSTSQKGLSAFLNSNVRVVDKMTLGHGLGVIHYYNSNDQIFYENPTQHTLSMYIKGGYKTLRTDKDKAYGAPGRFCLMPKDAYSSWQIGGKQNFVHLYFNDNYIKRLAMTVFDYDPRAVSLPELTFKEVPELEAIVLQCILNQNWDESNHLLIEQSAVTVLSHLIRIVVGNRPLKHYKSGLTPRVKNRVLDYMHAHYAGKVSLAELAEVAGLSEYHFSRMFRISLSQTPHQYLLELKIEEVKKRIRKSSSTGQSLARIALDCGFSNQSHMGRVFRKITGMTPRRFIQTRG